MTHTETRTLLALAVHPPSQAGTRLRVQQYGPHLAEGGWRLVLWTFLPETAMEAWYGPSQVKRLGVLLRGMLRALRLPILVRRSDVVLVRREALPITTAFVERWVSRFRPVVWDVDDAVWQPYTSPTTGRLSRLLRGSPAKYERLCRRADQVWAGSEVLAEWCRVRNRDVEVVPTVVSVPQRRTASGGSANVVWIGSHSTAPFLERILPNLQALDRNGVTLQVCGAGKEVWAPLPVENRAWSEETEAELLDDAAVGLYPIDPAHPYAEGKCGLKAILYMAHGVPPIVTPTATNRVIVRDGVDGVWVDDDSNWAHAILSLLANDEERRAMSANAYERAKQHYSLEVWAPRVRQLLETVAAGTQ